MGNMVYIVGIWGGEGNYIIFLSTPLFSTFVNTKNFLTLLHP